MMLTGNTIRSFAALALTASTAMSAAWLYADDINVEGDAALLAPTPYQARYEARARGLSTDAYRNLVQTSNNVYQLSHGLSLRLLGANMITVAETSHFYWLDTGAVPVSYTYEQSGLRRRLETIRFDWDSQRASVTRREQESATDIHPGLLDNLSFTAQMSSQLNARPELRNIGTVFDYEILDGTEPETQQYRVINREPVATLAGTLDTLLIERVRDPERNRSTRIWLAVDHEFVLTKLEQIEDGDTIDLLLSSMTMGDITLGVRE